MIAFIVNKFAYGIINKTNDIKFDVYCLKNKEEGILQSLKIKHPFNKLLFDFL